MNLLPILKTFAALAVLLALGGPAAYAQAEIDPDHFDSPSTEPIPRPRTVDRKAKGNRDARTDSAMAESAIRELVGVRQQQAWNQHDAHAYAELFAENADVVNVVAWWWKGRSEIESNLTRMFANIFRESTLTLRQVDVRFLTTRVAIAHARWTMTGAHMLPGLPEPHEGLQTLTMEKRNGKWLIAAFHNTNYVPPPTTAADKK